ncbi:MAG: NUDIX domain-containing protein [Candidatus Cloacimonetes bacterium]|nr:NUDIX domain-containing protein [Candidatus Cloacimonadota bacterium]
MAIKKDSYENVNFCLKCGNKMELKSDREGKMRPECTNCKWTYYKNPIPASACVIINDNKEIVIIKRKYEPNAGGWALPSGYVEIDQNPADCAIDEMKEETGLDGEVIIQLGYDTEFSPIYEKVISFGFLMKVTGGELQAGDDAVEARYVSFDELPKIAFPSHVKFIEIVRALYRKDNE